MAKIVALDIGGKRTGVAETDPLQIIASPRETVATDNLIPFLAHLFEEEEFEAIVLGDPKNLQGGDSHNSERVRKIAAELGNKFPTKRIIMQDERYSSKMAMQSLIDSGVKKMKRREKGEIDKVSAAIILQAYLAGQ